MNLFLLNLLKSLSGDRKFSKKVLERVGGAKMKFYTIKLPKILGGLVRAMLGAFKKG